MNKKKTPNNIEDLLSLFSETLTPADVLSAKLMAQFSNAITSERLNLNMSQKDFAKHINATQSLISRWECGDYNFSINKIAEIAAKLDLNVDFKINKYHSSTDTSRNDNMVTTEVPCKIIQFPNPYVAMLHIFHSNNFLIFFLLDVICNLLKNISRSPYHSFAFQPLQFDHV